MTSLEVDVSDVETNPPTRVLAIERPSRGVRMRVGVFAAALCCVVCAYLRGAEAVSPDTGSQDAEDCPSVEFMVERRVLRRLEMLDDIPELSEDVTTGMSYLDVESKRKWVAFMAEVCDVVQFAVGSASEKTSGEVTGTLAAFLINCGDLKSGGSYSVYSKVLSNKESIGRHLLQVGVVVSYLDYLLDNAVETQDGQQQ